MVDEMNDQPRVEEKGSRSVTPLTRQSQGVLPGRPSPAAPAWPALVVVLLVGIGLFAVSDFLTPEGAWRVSSDSLMVVLIFVAMAGWVRANRAALAQIDEHACERPPLEIRYVTSERPPLWRAEATRRRRGRVRLKGARHVSSGPERT
jgi:hypothetical protein